MDERDDRFDGFQVIKPTAFYNLPWKAAYGLHLMELCKAADEQSEMTGEFVPVDIPTEEEFRAMRKEMRRKKTYRSVSKKFVEGEYR